MSLINDALKRASQVHKQGPQDRGVLSGSPLQPVVGGRQRKRSPNIALMVLPVLIVLALGGSIWFFLQWRKSTHKTPAGPPAAATAAKPGAKPTAAAPKPVANAAASTPSTAGAAPTAAQPAAAAPVAAQQSAAQPAPAIAATQKPTAGQAAQPQAAQPTPHPAPAQAPAAVAEAPKPAVDSANARAAVASNAATTNAAVPSATNASQKSLGSSVSKLFGGGKSGDAGKNGPKLFPNIKLQGIFFRIKDPSALINGRSMVVGEEIEGAVIKKIERSTVTFEFQGESRVVSLR